MRRRWIITIALGMIGALALGSMGTDTSASAKTNKARQLGCAFELFSQGPPQGTPPRAISFGLVSCVGPLGKGVHYGSSTITPTSPGHGTVAVRFRKYFNRGTIRGTVAGTFAATTPMHIVYKGTVTVSGGTGAFKRVKGSGTLRCTSSDGGAHRSCKAKLKLKGL